MDNPFRYGRVATGEYFIGREKELRELQSDIRAGQDVVLISPRRYGKTSLLKEALDHLERQDLLTAYVDLFRTPSKERFVRALTTAISGMVDMKGRAWEKVRELFAKASLNPTATYNQDGSFSVDLGVGAERARDFDAALERLLTLPQKIAEDRGRRVVLVLDEFQQITEIDPNLPAIMRSEFQLQTDVAHVYAGSQRHIMERMFTGTNEPMYRMAKPMHLGPIGDAAFTEFIRSRFATTGQKIDDDAVARILEITGGHPANTQELAYFTWNLAATEGAVATPELVNRALGAVVEAEDDRFTLIWGGLSAHQKLVLTALAQPGGASAIYSEAYRRAHNLGASSSLDRSLTALRDADLIRAGAKKGEYSIPDPFLRAWIAYVIANGAGITG